MIKTVTEFCTGCVHEREILWNIEQDGSLETFCPYRGRRHMPCDERRHDLKDEIERISASAKAAAEACAATRASLSDLASTFSELAETLAKEPEQAYLDYVRGKIHGGKR